MKKYLSAFLFMLFAAAMQWISLTLFDSLLLCLFLLTMLFHLNTKSMFQKSLVLQ